MTPLYKILDIARWAPSGDNSQPWRFEFVSENEVLIHSFNLSKNTIQDYKGSYSQFSLGTFFENLRVAASEYGSVSVINLDVNPNHLIYSVKLEINPNAEKNPLIPSILNRCTNRFPYSFRLLSKNEKTKIEKCLEEGWSIEWHEPLSKKLKIASMLFLFDLVAEPETSGIIEWNCKSSKYKLADETLGLSRFNLKVARFMFSSKRNQKWLFDRFGGKYSSALLGFVIPAIRTGAHFSLISPQELKTKDDFIKAGEIYQRIWLTATEIGLNIQMESGPVIFSRYIRDGKKPYTDEHKQKKLINLEHKFRDFYKNNATRVVMLSRIGYAPLPHARSDRLSVEELIYDEKTFGTV